MSAPAKARSSLSRLIVSLLPLMVIFLAVDEISKAVARATLSSTANLSSPIFSLAVWYHGSPDAPLGSNGLLAISALFLICIGALLLLRRSLIADVAILFAAEAIAVNIVVGSYYGSAADPNVVWANGVLPTDNAANLMIIITLTFIGWAVAFMLRPSRIILLAAAMGSVSVIGNVIEGMWRGSATDFMALRIGHDFSYILVFNLADAMCPIAGILLLVGLIWRLLTTVRSAMAVSHRVGHSSSSRTLFPSEPSFLIQPRQLDRRDSA